MQQEGNGQWWAGGCKKEARIGVFGSWQGKGLLLEDVSIWAGGILLLRFTQDQLLQALVNNIPSDLTVWENRKQASSKLVRLEPPKEMHSLSKD